MIEELMRPEVRAFILAHQNDDPAALALSGNKYSNLPMALIAKQIKSRQKAKNKVPTYFNNSEIIYPKGVSMEQSSSERAALYKANLLQRKTLIDLTGGFGVDSYFFSQKFEQVHYVEQSGELCRLGKINFDLLKSGNIQVHNQPCEEFIKRKFVHSVVCYLDPARRDSYNNKVVKLEDCQPNVLTLVPELLKKNCTIVIKLSPMLDIKLALTQLPQVKEVHTVAVDNECKELVFIIEPEFNGHVNIIATNLTLGTKEIFNFTFEEEAQPAQFSMPLKYLFEPNVAIMKAGGYNCLANRFKQKKLHRNSHLFTSNQISDDFPGRKFEITAVSSLNRKALRKETGSNQANITVRNYPTTVEIIRKKSGLKDGGENYLFATTTMDNKPCILICKRIS